MSDVTATEAARHFADLLDGVEHRGEHYTIVRRGRAIALLEPIETGRGSDVKEILRRHRPDTSWRSDLESIRSFLEVDERP